jgi:DNA-binding transcriptional ArsR family regulator
VFAAGTLDHRWPIWRTITEPLLARHRERQLIPCGPTCTDAGYHLRMHESIEGFQVPDVEVVEHTCELLRILSDPTRLRLLYALSQGESSVACLAEIAGANPTAVSQQLSKLRMSGIVKARRQGTFMFYTIIDPTVKNLLAAILGRPGLVTDASIRTNRNAVGV